MSRRTSILKAIMDKLKTIDGNTTNINLYGNAFAKLKYWDDVNDFPSVYGVAGTEVREYLPGEFVWGYLNTSLKVYCKGEDSQEQLELLLEDIENTIDANRALVYDIDKNYETTEILVTSITTDEGLLVPFAIGEINLQIRYQVM